MKNAAEASARPLPDVKIEDGFLYVHGSKTRATLLAFYMYPVAQENKRNRNCCVLSAR